MVIAQRRELKLLTLTGLGLDCDFITFMKMCVQACLDSYDINSEDHVNPNHNQEILKRRKKKHGIPTLPARSPSDSSQSQDTTAADIPLVQQGPRAVHSIHNMALQKGQRIPGMILTRMRKEKMTMIQMNQ